MAAALFVVHWLAVVGIVLGVYLEDSALRHGSVSIMLGNLALIALSVYTDGIAAAKKQTKTYEDLRRTLRAGLAEKRAKNGPK